MLTLLCDAITRVVTFLMWIAFAALIGAVALQVLARNVIHDPMIWTSDLAQLFFTWLIFVGAAIGLRSGAHYRVDLIGAHRVRLSALADVISIVAGVAVAVILLWFGWQLAVIRQTAQIQSLGLSRFWIFLPMPVSGALMLVFLAEMVLTRRGPANPDPEEIAAEKIAEVAQ